jgi:hypothetical protein
MSSSIPLRARLVAAAQRGVLEGVVHDGLGLVGEMTAASAITPTAITVNLIPGTQPRTIGLVIICHTRHR